MKTEEEIILKHDNRLLKDEKSWRRARIGAGLLFLIFLIALLVIYGDDLISADERHQALIAIAIWCFFWLLIIESLTLRIRHIDSIKLYRENKRQPQTRNVGINVQHGSKDNEF
jgi:type VI protein secretion system component VasK